MLSDYTFLTDHSYSLRAVADDSNELTKTSSTRKNKKSSRSSSRSNKKTSPTNRTVSIDRSSSDKENNSTTNTNVSSASVASVNSVRTARKKATGSSRSTMSNSRNPSTKKTNRVKTSQGTITKKNNRNSRKSLNVYPISMESKEIPLSLSIEERVKLRRTATTTTAAVAPTAPAASRTGKNSISNKKSQNSSRKTPPVHDDLKQIRQSLKKEGRKSSPPSVSVHSSTIRTKKSFLGSGLDLDNIVLGNRQRRGVQS